MITDQEKKVVLEYLEKGAEFMFVPTSFLCDLVSKGDEKTDGINKQLKIYILEKKPIRLSEDIIKKYCNGGIDLKNKWVLDNGDIKIIPNRFELKNK